MLFSVASTAVIVGKESCHSFLWDGVYIGKDLGKDQYSAAHRYGPSLGPT